MTFIYVYVYTNHIHVFSLNLMIDSSIYNIDTYQPYIPFPPNDGMMILLSCEISILWMAQKESELFM